MSAIEFCEFHKSIYDDWVHGEMAEVWTDDAGNTCIRYSDGVWYHYRIENGEVIFW